MPKEKVNKAKRLENIFCVLNKFQFFQKRKMVRAKKRKKVTNKSHSLDDLIQRFLYTKSSDNDYYLKKFKSETSIKRLQIKNIKNNNS